jgi:Spy/CpxP family protein refolding chaperone
MKRINLRKTLSAAALIGGALVGASALADPPPQGAYGPGYGMGPGMMGGYGAGYGMGPGMMDGYGGAYGMGVGMMDDQGRGYGSRADLNLTAEQRGKIAAIQNDVRHKHWDLMGKMQDEQSQMNEQYNADPRDDAALSKSYRHMSELRHQMFDLSLSARRQIDAVLTTEQRDKIRHG